MNMNIFGKEGIGILFLQSNILYLIIKYMNDVYYLVHVTKNYSEEWSELKPSSLNDYKD